MKKSLFVKLYYKILIIVCIFFLTLFWIQLSETFKVLNQKRALLVRFQNEKIQIISESLSNAFHTSDSIITNNIKNSLYTIGHLIKINNGIAENFIPQIQEINPERVFDKLYIVKDSRIIFNTDKNDTTLLYLSISDIRKRYRFKSLNEAGKLYLSPWKSSDSLNVLSRNGYFITSSGQFLIGIEYQNIAGYDLIHNYMDQLKTFTRENIEDSDSQQSHLTEIPEINLDKPHSDTIDSAFFSRIIRHIDEPDQMAAFIRGKSATGFQISETDQKTANVSNLKSFIIEVKNNKTQLLASIKKQLIVFLCFIMILSIIYYILVRNPNKSLSELLVKSKLFAAGTLNERIKVKGKNDISELSVQINTMIDRLKTTQEELQQKNSQIESGLKELKELNEEITTQKEEIEAQRDIVTAQKDEILTQKTEITQSIMYASRIQKALLPPDDVVKYLLPKHFILYKPRDVVSGDFYWLTHKNKEIIVVVADCTGHGVPGAFMSMLGYSLLKDIVNKSPTLKAGTLLNDLREQVILSLRQTGETNESKDGMDMSLCIINMETMHMQFAGAYNSLILIRDGKLNEYKADRMPVGISHHAAKPFTNYEIELVKEDAIYLYTDGYADQIGGKEGKKLKSIQFRQLILEMQDRIMYNQKEQLELKLNEWMNPVDSNKVYDQVDDITVMGIKF